MPTIEELFAKAIRAHQAKDLAQARVLYERVLSLAPAHLHSLDLLAAIAKQQGDFPTELRLRKCLLNAAPEAAERTCDLADALMALAMFDAAVVEYQRAIALKPQLLDSYCGLGLAYAQTGRNAEAVAAFREAIKLNDRVAILHFNLGSTLRDMGNLEDAETALRRAVALEPQTPWFQTNLGNVLLDLGRIDDAEVFHRGALASQPDSVELLTNLGNALMEKRRLTEAAILFRAAISTAPAEAEPHNNLGHVLLTQGKLVEGFEELEWRAKQRSFSSPIRDFDQPQWDGADLKDKTLLIHAEQGIGDSIQFCRYIPIAAQRARHTIVEGPSSLRRLLSKLPGIGTWVDYGEPLPPFDFHCPMLSLPRALRSIPHGIPPVPRDICANAAEIARWSHRLQDTGDSLRVGLAWAGNPTQANDRLRSMKLADLSPLADLKNIRFFSLQKGAAAGQIEDSPFRGKIADHTSELHDFADTAALIANLDLVVTVCTSVAHLAGSIGVPTWTMLRFAADWRWFESREDSPWYPSMRLFRQSRICDWSDPVVKVAAALARYTKPVRSSITKESLPDAIKLIRRTDE